MKPFDFAQDRLRAIPAAPAKNPGLHPGYQRNLPASGRDPAVLKRFLTALPKTGLL
jgi:hypothetical protein